MNTILELRDKLDSGSVTSKELFNNSVDMACEYQEKYKYVCKDGPVFSFEQHSELPPEY